MADKKGWGSTVLGWFVVREGEESDDKAAPSGDAAADELIAKYAADAPPAADAAAAPTVQLQGDVSLPTEAGAPIDFPAVYRAAGVDDDEQGRIDKALALLKTLPAETPKEVKRSIVEASLKAFGYPVDQIIEAGVAEIQALQAFIEIGQRDTQKVLGEANQRIEALQQEITELKALMEKKVGAQYQLTNQCNEQKLKVQEVLEFFGQDAVARVVKESPKLVEPGQK